MAPSTSTADILIRARDEASKRFGVIGKSALNMGQMLRRAAALAGVYFGGRALINLAKESLDLYGIQIDAENKLLQAYNATGGAVGILTDELKKYAAELQSVTRFGDEVIIEGMSLLMTFKNLQGDGFKRATELALDLSTAMGGEGFLKSTMIQLGKALNDPLKGMTQLQRIGVSFTEQQVQQVRQLVKTNRLFEAQTVIMDELSSQFGGQARAAVNSYAGAWQRMANAIGDLKEKIGQALTPTMIRFADNMRVWAERNQEVVYTWVAKSVSYAELFKDAFASLLSYMKTDFWGGIEWVWNSFLAVMKQVAISSFDLGVAIGKGVWAGMKEGLSRGAQEQQAAVRAEERYKKERSDWRENPSTVGMGGAVYTTYDSPEILEKMRQEERAKIQIEKRDEIFGPTLKVIEEEWRELGKDLRKSMPAELGEKFDKLYQEHLKRLKEIESKTYGQPNNPAGKTLATPAGDGGESQSFSRIGVNAVEARFLSGVSVNSYQQETARNTREQRRELAKIAQIAQQQYESLERININLGAGRVYPANLT